MPSQESPADDGVPIGLKLEYRINSDPREKYSQDAECSNDEIRSSTESDSSRHEFLMAPLAEPPLQSSSSSKEENNIIKKPVISDDKLINALKMNANVLGKPPIPPPANKISSNLTKPQIHQNNGYFLESFSINLRYWEEASAGNKARFKISGGSVIDVPGILYLIFCVPIGINI